MRAVLCALALLAGCKGDAAPDACDAYARLKAQCVDGPADGVERRREGALLECRAARAAALPVRDAMRLATDCAQQAQGACAKFDACVREHMSLGR